MHVSQQEDVGAGYLRTHQGHNLYMVLLIFSKSAQGLEIKKSPSFLTHSGRS